jgi:hypothetical protein
VEGVELLDKRGYLTICISVAREGKVFLRNTEGIRDWYDAVRDNITKSKTRYTNCHIFCNFMINESPKCSVSTRFSRE